MAGVARKVVPPSAATPRYELGSVLGVGGMGTIYSAYDRLTRRTLAYKRLKVRDESMRARVTALFQREYDTVARLNHPNVVTAYDYGFDSEGPYYTMELLSGADLKKHAGSLSVRETCQIARDMASALALLHARRLVHRDISPNNVRVIAAGRAKLLDFGSLTPFGVASEIVGTVPFIAPESVRRQTLDQRTDLYSLGALLYWTLTGRVHVSAKGLEDLHDAWSLPLVRPSTYVPELPAELDALIMSLLAQDAVLRPPSAGAVMERLTNIAELAPEADELTVAYSYLQQPPLIGREAALSELTSTLPELLDGRGQVALIEAPHGMGRSAVLDQLAIDAQLAGATVLRAAEVASAPLATARHLIERGLAIFPDQAHVLGELAPALDPVRSAAEATERYDRLSNKLASSLLALSERAPLVLLIDDVHRIDAASLGLFAALRQSLAERPILLLLSRETGAASADDAALDKLVAQATCVSLAPLREREVQELLSAIFGAVPHRNVLARWSHAESGGNPAQLMDLLRLLLQRGLVQYARGSFVLPHEIQAFERSDAAALTARIEGVGPLALRIVQLLSLHEGALRADDLVHASELDPELLAQALEGLGARGVLRCSSAGYELASASLRAAVSAALTDDQRAERHLALARTLAKRQASDGAARSGSLEAVLELARHLLYAGPDGELEGAKLIARATSETAYELAMTAGSVPVVTRALAVFQQRGYDDRDCAGLLVTLGISGYYGDLATQRAYLDRALEALSRLIGLHGAGKAQRWLGARGGLFAGLIGAFWIHLLAPRPLYRASLKRTIEVFLNLVGAASAAAASSLNPREALRIASFLDPFTALPEGSGPCIVRDFSLATAESASGRARAAVRRYDSVIARLAQPIAGFNEYTHWQLLSGAIYGCAQAEVTGCTSRSLALADELETKSTFHRPHAYTVRMIYHLFRGEQAAADACRARADEITSRTGTSWSAAIVLAVRGLQASILTGDLINLVRAIAELRRMIAITPNIAAYYELATGHLELLRQHPDRALPIYERVLSSEFGQDLPSYPFDASLRARALLELGEPLRARLVCEQVIELERTKRWDTELLSRLPRQQLALAHAALGDCELARKLLDEQLALARPLENPLALGSLARDRARVALAARDAEQFEREFEAMSSHYRATENPWLVQQCEALHGLAVQAGLRARDALGPRTLGPGLRAADLAAAETMAVETLEEATRVLAGTAVSGVRESRAPR